MSGEMNTEAETLFDSDYRPDLASARDVLAFVLTPVKAFGPMSDAEVTEVSALLLAAKEHAIVEWRKLQKRR